MIKMEEGKTTLKLNIHVKIFEIFNYIFKNYRSINYKYISLNKW